MSGPFRGVPIIRIEMCRDLLWPPLFMELPSAVSTRAPDLCVLLACGINPAIGASKLRTYGQGSTSTTANSNVDMPFHFKSDSLREYIYIYTNQHPER